MKPNRFLLVVTIFALGLAPFTSKADQLTIAVIQYTDLRDPAAMQAAFAETDLTTITDSDTVEAKNTAIRGGRVVFVQTLPIGKSGPFASSTRLTNQRADIQGSVSGNTVSAEITIQEGVSVGIRKFTRSTYAGSGAVAGLMPSIISSRSSTGRTQTAVKGQSKLTNYTFTTLIIAQIKR